MLTGKPCRSGKQTVGGIVSCIQYDIGAELSELRVEFVVDCKLSRVHDANPHACGDCMYEEHRVHCFAHGVVSSEREREV